MPRILFVHQNFPAQFGGLSHYLQSEGWDVLFANAVQGVPQHEITKNHNLKIIGFSARREPAKAIHRYLDGTEKAVLNGQGFAQMAVRLLHSGYVPDIVVAHSGWGSGSFARAVWPEAKYVQYLEWWYNYPEKDPETCADETITQRDDIFDRRAGSQCKNLPALLDFAMADAVISPTRHQASTFPEFLREKTTVMHDGIDCKLHSPGPRQLPVLADGASIPPGAPILTYATRGMEPTRGFMEFMEALSRLQKINPDVHTLIAGKPTVHYGSKLAEGDSYKKRAMETWDFDHDRIHWVGRLPRSAYRDLLRSSDCHVYLTKPFVLSWSLIEAMGIGCPLVVSDNATVREALPGKHQAVHVDHSDTDALVDAMCRVLADPVGSRKMGKAARRRALRYYDQEKLYPMHRDFFLDVIGAGRE